MRKHSTFRRRPGFNRLDVRSGSSTDLMVPKSNFRSTPESGLKSDIALCPKSANYRLMHCNIAASFDHLVGDREQLVGDGQTKCFGGFAVDRQSVFGRQHHRQVARLLALENAANVAAGLAIGFGSAGAIVSRPPASAVSRSE
jgi:hypothetical protein